MTEVVGDIVQPSVLIIPNFEASRTTPMASGAIWLSGGAMEMRANDGSIVVVG